MFGLKYQYKRDKWVKGEQMKQKLSTYLVIISDLILTQGLFHICLDVDTDGPA